MPRRATLRRRAPRCTRARTVSRPRPERRAAVVRPARRHPRRRPQPLLVPASAHIIDFLAAFEADQEDVGETPDLEEDDPPEVEEEDRDEGDYEASHQRPIMSWVSS